MTRHPEGASLSPRQRGLTTLLVAVLLIAMLSVITLLVLQAGLFEPPAGDATADAELDAAAVFLKAESHGITRTWMAGATNRWARCARPDTGWPCGAEPDPDRRETLFRYQFGNDDPDTRELDERFAIDPPSGGSQRDRAMSQAVVGGLLCMVDASDPLKPTCSTTVDPARGWGGAIAVTLVSRPAGGSGNAAGVVKETIGSYRAINGPPDVPVIASGVMDGLGRAEVVPAPNAGGFGVPLSVWANRDVDPTDGGVLATCHLGEFLANRGSGSPTTYDGITICRTCRCSGLDLDRGLLSGTSTGKGTGSSQYEGVDILDVDGSSAATPQGALPDTSYFPFHPLDDAANPLDDSLFEYVFGVDNASEADSSLVDADHNGRDDGRDYLEGVSRILASADCTSLGRAAQGLLYVPPAVSCRISGQLGTPIHPVALVVDGDVEFATDSVVYGMVFAKRNLTQLSSLRVAGAMQLYGALVVEGRLDIRGTPQFIFNDQVLRNLTDSKELQRFGVLPGKPDVDASRPNDAGTR